MASSSVMLGRCAFFGRTSLRRIDKGEYVEGTMAGGGGGYCDGLHAVVVLTALMCASDGGSVVVAA